MEELRTEERVIALRREFHRYPEEAWTEYRTTCRVIEELKKLGLPVWYGRRIHTEANMHDLPAAERDGAALRRAMEEGCPEDLLIDLSGGYTGCVTAIRGAKPGRTVAFRVDLDCNEVEESEAADHRPAAEGFRSLHPGRMHACGHDGHAAVGICLAEELAARREELCGTVRILFQPAEEGLRGGAASMAASGVLGGADVLIGSHVGMGLAPTGAVAASVRGLMASSKLDVRFHGRAAHAANCPEQGKNALLAAATAVTELLKLPGEGTLLNVGTFVSEAPRNVIPPEALLRLETRGVTSALNESLAERALEVCREAAERYGCTVESDVMGQAGTALCDESLALEMAEVLKTVPGVGSVVTEFDFRASEDVTEMMTCVQQRGGRATETVFGTPLAAPHHSSRFDFDEAVLPLMVRSLTALAMELTKRETEKEGETA